ncbi:MAG: membrane integrity-associated transporter subunit PqiC [Magnetococcales bacterium]|nr:membrane integrity-associated transporter subunit PqiC [Magnetococcales bacterium]
MHVKPKQVTLKRLSRGVLMVGSALLLAACVGERSPPTRYFGLDAMDHVQSQRSASGKEAVGLAIKPIHLPRYLNRRNIVVRHGENRLAMSPFHQWAGNLSEEIGRVLTINLSTLLDSPRVAQLPQLELEKPDLVLEVDILRFEGENPDRVVMLAQWRLRSNDKSIASPLKVSLYEEPLEKRSGYARFPRAMSKVLARFSREVANVVRQMHVNHL